MGTYHTGKTFRMAGADKLYSNLFKVAPQEIHFGENEFKSMTNV